MIQSNGPTTTRQLVRRFFASTFFRLRCRSGDKNTRISKIKKIKTTERLVSQNKLIRKLVLERFECRCVELRWSSEKCRKQKPVEQPLLGAHKSRALGEFNLHTNIHLAPSSEGWQLCNGGATEPAAAAVTRNDIIYNKISTGGWMAVSRGKTVERTSLNKTISGFQSLFCTTFFFKTAKSFIFSW